jgi:siderophore synthetase component
VLTGNPLTDDVHIDRLAAAWRGVAADGLAPPRDTFVRAHARAARLTLLRLTFAALNERFVEAGATTLRDAGDALALLYRESPEDDAQAHGECSLTEVRAFVDRLSREIAPRAAGAHVTDAGWCATLAELESCVVNETLALVAREEVAAAVRREARGARDMATWLRARRGDGPAHARFVERFASLKGNPTHPMSKLRGELRPEDVLRYAPEFGPVLDVPLAAIVADEVSVRGVAGAAGYRAQLARHFPRLCGAWDAAVRARGRDPCEYVPMPVHPLQVAEVRGRFAPLFETGRALLLERVCLRAQPTTSMRTMMPVGEGEGEVHVKLPVAIRTTSMLRTKTSERLWAVPILTDLIAEVLARHGHFRDALRMVPERIGAWLRDDREDRPREHSYHCNLLLRDDPETCVRRDELRLPLSAAFARSPFTGRPVFVDLMTSAGVTGAASAGAWFGHYVDVVVTGQLGIYARYGISLEAHQQNVHLVFAPDGSLRATLIQDLAGGVMLHEEALQRCGIDLRPHLHPYIPKPLHADVEAPLQQFQHTTLFYHLLPLAQVVAEAFGVTHARLVAEVAGAIARTLDEVAGEDGPWRKHVPFLRHALLVRDMRTPALLTMRLNQTQERLGVVNGNPLAGQLGDGQ